MSPAERPPDQEPQVAACLAFVFAAISGLLSLFAWFEWKDAAAYVESMPRHSVEGGMALALNAGIALWELMSYVTGLPALIGILAVVCWKPAMLRSWLFFAGMICLLPALLLLLARFGIRLF